MKTIKALTFDVKEDGWETSRGFSMRQIAMPVLDEKSNVADAGSVILKMKYAGVCGSDKGIWSRKAFKDLIHGSLAREDKTTRILGHELLGEVVQVGSAVKNVVVGNIVSGDSHVTCGECYQCKIGENNVCTNEAILGISMNGIFAEYVKLPAKNLFVIDAEKIRPEIAAIMDPFGNAVHAVSKTEVRSKTVAVFGAGPIGLFAILLLRHFGAAKIIAIDINQENLNIAKELGCDEIILLNDNKAAVAKIWELTQGVGADITMEMAGPESSVINCLESARRGGHVILFGVKDGDFTIPTFSKVITKGLTLHGVIGRRIFETWNTAAAVLSDKSNGVQEKMWDIILKKGGGTVVPFAEYNKEAFEKVMNKNPKVIFKFNA